MSAARDVATVTPVPPDPHAAELALGAPEPLAAFNAAGVLAAADVHVAGTLLALAGVRSDGADHGPLALAGALAVRAPRLGHVFVDLADVADTVASEDLEGPIGELAWPTPAAWLEVLSAHPELIAVGEDDAREAPLRPLRLTGSRLYLDRYWREERNLARILLGLDGQPVRGLELAHITELLEGLFPDPRDSAQRAAAACAALRGLTVVAGGPGTGKTTTVARTVALLAEAAHRAGEPTPLLALCAPTGKAAARLGQAIAAEAPGLDISAPARAALGAIGAATIHRLLGARGEGRFRHGAANPLPHDVVIVDETSMVSLSLISHLLAAVRTDARVVLVGDPDQLSAIEAGAVLRDIVGPAAAGSTFGPGMRSILTRTTGSDPGAASVQAPFGSGVVMLTRGHRYGAPINALAEAIRGGHTEAALEALSAGEATIRWIEADAAQLAADATASVPLRELVSAEFSPMLAAARSGDVGAALGQLGRMRLLCAHREGRYGVRSWTLEVEAWLSQDLGLALEGTYAGRPLLISENDYELGLYNGDSGVVVAADGDLAACFEHEDGHLAVAPARLAAVQSAYASTIHKSQGSQFATVVVILPDAQSRLLTRELLYTAVTRAQERLVIVGSPAALAGAIARPVQRATGLGDRLWGIS